MWAKEMADQITVLVTKPDNLSCILRTRMVEGENRLNEVMKLSSGLHSSHMHSYIETKSIKVKKEMFYRSPILTFVKETTHVCFYLLSKSLNK